MYFRALATDYDGSIAHDGVVSALTLAALERVKLSGRQLVLVTGRQLPDLARVFPQLDLFDRAVAENGALLYVPRAREERMLARSAFPRFVEALRSRGVAPLSVGRCIVATTRANMSAMLETIRDMGLDLQITLNKEAAMVLPAGVDKASGLAAAVHDLQLSLDDVVGVGDAENDCTFLDLCGLSAAVANALPALKDKVDIRLDRCDGEGVAALVSSLLSDDREAR